MANLAELKAHAIRLFAKGEALHSLRLYDAIVTAAPTDFSARIEVGDCLVALGETPAAIEVYRAVGWYVLRSGHPLACIVLARVIANLGGEADDLLAALVVRYGRESEIVAEFAARINPPDGATPIAPPDLHSPPPVGFLEQAAHRAATCLDDFDDYPETVHAIPLLSGLSEDAFRRVLATLKVRRLPDGELFIREGEPGQSLFFVATGEVRVYATDGLGRETEYARLHENSIVGEMALLSAQPRSASVQVVGEADLIEVSRQSLAALADELTQVATELHSFTRARFLKNLMATNRLFRPFNPAQRRDLLRRFTSHDVAVGTAIIHQGEEGAGLFVVLSGEVEVTKADDDGTVTPLATLRSGAVFGEMSLVRGGPTAATVTAARPSTVLFLAREHVARLMSSVSEIKLYLEALSQGREVETERLLAGDFDEDEQIILI